jgi:hypothetical protein
MNEHPLSDDVMPTFRPLSLMPAADGWRALYLGAQDYEVVPLVAWGVFEEAGGPSVPDSGISGVVADRTYPHRVRYLIRAEDRLASTFPFAGYLAPGMPEPTPADLGGTPGG